MTTTPTFGFALDYVTDIQKSRAFYVDVLGLKVEREHPTYVQFPSFTIATDEAMTAARDPELYWLVDDAEAARNAMPKGDPTEIRAMPFGKVFSVNDPDGRPRCVLEFAANRPSQAAS